jgi:hypothetical protein
LRLEEEPLARRFGVRDTDAAAIGVTLSREKSTKSEVAIFAKCLDFDADAFGAISYLNLTAWAFAAIWGSWRPDRANRKGPSAHPDDEPLAG